MFLKSFTTAAWSRSAPHRMFVRALCLTLGLMMVVAANFGTAQTAPYPSRPVRLIVPFPAGGSTDIISRLTGQKLGEAFGQQVVIDNRPGAAANIGTELAMAAAPDGHTLLMATPGFVINPSLQRNVRFDPQRDFAAVAYVAITPLMVASHPSVPAKTLQELVALAKARPGSLNYASAGSSTHLATELFKSFAGIDLVHVPYKGGAPATSDLMAGQVQVMFDNILSALPHVKTGKLRGLAVTGPKRSALAPEVPAVAESGYPAYQAASWFAIVAPARTPEHVIKRINAELNRMLAAPEVRERFASIGAEPTGGASAELTKFLATESAKWRRLINEKGLRGES